MTVGYVNEPKSKLSRLATSFTLSNNSPLSSNFESVESQSLPTNHSANYNSITTKPRADLRASMDTSFNQRLRRMMSKSGVTLVTTRLIRNRNVSEAPCAHDQSLAARPSARSYHHPSGHWTLGMTLFFVFLLSALSTSSTVMCGPVRPQGAPKPGFPSSSHELDMISNSRMRQFPPVLEQQSVRYSLQPKGQLHLSSLLENRPVAVAAAMASSPQAEYFRSAATTGNGRTHQVGNEQDVHPNNYVQLHQQEHFPEENNLERLPIQKTLKGLTGTPEDVEGVSNLDEHATLDEDYMGQPSSEWETVIDPHLYLLTEWKSQSQPYQQDFPLVQQQQRKRRNSGMGNGLSIVNPLDVLRQRLLLEIIRRRNRETQNRITNNDEFLRKIGR